MHTNMDTHTHTDSNEYSIVVFSKNATITRTYKDIEIKQHFDQTDQQSHFGQHMKQRQLTCFS